MTSEVVLLISILCLIKCTWCGNYGFGLGQRHSNDEILHQELLTNNGDSNESIIEYIYIAEKPVSYMQLRTDTNIYMEVTILNSSEMYIKLSNFEQIEFNATLTVYGFPWHPDGPEPDDIQFLLQPKKIVYLSSSSVEDSSIIATNGAYVSKEKSKTKEDSNGAEENEESGSSDSSSDTSEYYDYDFTSTKEKHAEERELDTIIDAIRNFDVMNHSIVVQLNVFIFISILCVTIYSYYDNIFES